MGTSSKHTRTTCNRHREAHRTHVGHVCLTDALYCSPVFRDMIKNSTSSRFHLTDSELETHEMVVSLLRSLENGAEVWEYMWEEGFRRIQLLRKFDCHRVLEQIRLAVRLELRAGEYKLECSGNNAVLFVIAVALGDLELCIEALAPSSAYTCLPTDFTIEQATLIGVRPMYAFMQAYSHTMAECGRHDDDTMADAFRRRMDGLGKSTRLFFIA